MHYYSKLFLLSAIALPCLAASNTKRIIHETRDLATETWSKKSKVQPGRVLPVRIGISQSNLEKGHDMLMDVSDPHSSNFGKHLSIEEVTELFAPPQEAIDAITEWLQESGISSERVTQTTNKGWIAFDAETEELEGLLLTEYHEYEHPESLHTSIGCERYHIPEHLQKHVDYITPGVNLMARSAHRPTMAPELNPIFSVFGEDVSPEATTTEDAEDLTSCDKSLTPACIAALYGIPPASGACAGNSLGIYSEGQYTQESLDNFFANVSTKIPLGTRPNIANVDGGSVAPSSALVSFETELDLQIAYPIIYPQNITLFEVDTHSNGTGFLNTFLDSIDGSYCASSTSSTQGLQCGSYKPTNVISVSYGGGEMAPSAEQRQCKEFMKLGLQGVTVVFSTGDNGVSGIQSKCLGTNGRAFNPQFPASCPYVTAVGGTEVFPGKTVNDPESAWPSSGGGFSNIFSSPSYQKAAVSSYFNNSDPGYAYYSGTDKLGANGGLYNRSGRAYPDVSANANGILIANGTRLTHSGGTSASAPTFASIINRINEERIKTGKGPVGFVNPTLYKNPGVLNDIVNGTNPGCGSQGFRAVRGWDPVTGLGTPNFGRMRDLFVGLP